MVSQLEKQNIQNYERFNAIVPTQYVHPANQMLYNSSCYGRGVVGCKLSHIAVIQIAKERGYKSILILEDDALFNPSFSTVLSDVIEQSRKLDWEMLYLGANYSEPGVALTSLLKRCTGAYTTSSYIIKSPLFDIVINSINTPVEIDTFYVKHIQPNYICLGVSPNIMCQMPSHSDISNEFTDYEFKEC
jgi:GR25 family glycosyltransferase involved in LPS biosynthesis